MCRNSNGFYLCFQVHLGGRGLQQEISWADSTAGHAHTLQHWICKLPGHLESSTILFLKMGEGRFYSFKNSKPSAAVGLFLRKITGKVLKTCRFPPKKGSRSFYKFLTAIIKKIKTLYRVEGKVSSTDQWQSVTRAHRQTLTSWSPTSWGRTSGTSGNCAGRPSNWFGDTRRTGSKPVT